jgi:membrane protease YdiL (CAAX protease family)
LRSNLTLTDLKDAAKLGGYFVATLLVGALVAPILFWCAQSLATHGTFAFLAKYDFETYFHRALLIAAVLLLWPLLRVSHVRGMADLGLSPNPRWGRDVIAGAVISVVPLLFCGALLIACHIYSVRHSFAWPRLGKTLVGAMAVPFIEEPFFRGIVLGVLLRTGRKYLAIFIVSALFAVVHFLKAPERTSEIVTWTSGFSSIVHAFDGLGDPTILVSALATLFFIGWILADGRVLTHSLWLPIGLHAGWIFGSGAFSRLARQQVLAFPWIGKDMLVGIIPLFLAALTWLIMRKWLKYDRAS